MNNQTNKSEKSEIEKRILELEEKFVSDSIFNNDTYQEKLIERLENVFIKKILKHPVLIFGKFLLAGVVLLGLAVWGIGSFSNSFQLKNVNDEAEKTILLIKKTNTDIEKTSSRIKVLEDSISTLFGANSSKLEAIINEVSREAEIAKRKIKEVQEKFEINYTGANSDSIFQLKMSINNELASLKSFNENAKKEHEKLITNLDISTKNVDSAIESFITLDLKAMNAFFTSLVGVTSLVLLILIFVSLTINIILISKYNKLKNKITNADK